jgi:hypothetical protein
MQGNVELTNGEPRRALREFSVASLFDPADPSIYVLMARARLAMNGNDQYAYLSRVRSLSPF